MAKISIIVPVYNAEPFLRPCLDSILAQTVADWECVLVDDGSKDGSGQTCDEYAARDSRFVVVHKPNEGVAKARIAACEHSHGELITFIDSDDTVSPVYLEKLSRPILEDGADMVSCDYYSVREGVKREPPAKRTGCYVGAEIKDFIREYYFYDRDTTDFGMTCFLCTKMMRRELVLEALKMGEGMWFGEDQISMFYVLTRSHKLVLLSDRLYNYIFHEGQAVKRYEWSLWENIIHMLAAYQKFSGDYPMSDGLRKRTWLNITTTTCRKMRKAGIDRKTFVAHLAAMRNTPYMKEFFRPMHIGLKKKDEKMYWLLKLKLYNLTYYYILRLENAKRKRAQKHNKLQHNG